MQSAKTNQNVEQVFFTIARDIKQRLTETVAAAAEVSILTPMHMFSLSDWLPYKSVTPNLFPNYAAANYSDQQARSRPAEPCLAVVILL